MNVAEVLRAAAAERGDSPAIVGSRGAKDRVATFRGLWESAGSVAARLSRDGVGEGDRVLVFVPMSAALYAVLLGVWRLGAVAVVADASADRSRIEASCERLAPRAFVGSPKAQLLRLGVAGLRRVPLAFVAGGSFPGAPRLDAGSSAATPVVELADDAPALVTMTSGSTGAPKFAVRTHGFLLRQHEVIARHVGLAPEQVDLATLPVFALANLASGVATVIPDADLRRPGFIDAAPVVRQIARLGVTRISAAPAFLERVVAECERTGVRLDVADVHTGGGPVFPRLLDRVAAVAPAARITAVYGSTEAEPIATLPLAEIGEDARLAMAEGAGLPAGRVVEEIELRILPVTAGPLASFPSRDVFESACLPPGEAGEIVVTGEHVLRGYLDGRGDADTKFDVAGERWHRTGDAGRLDVDGRLWLLGRAGARIEDADGVVYPFAVEAAAMEHAEVERAALALHDGRRVLLVQPRSAAVDVAALRRSLAWAHVPEIRLVDEIPMDARHNAKVDYTALQRLVAKGA